MIDPGLKIELERCVTDGQCRFMTYGGSTGNLI
jgi:hypothetical protein